MVSTLHSTSLPPAQQDVHGSTKYKVLILFYEMSLTTIQKQTTVAYSQSNIFKLKTILNSCLEKRGAATLEKPKMKSNQSNLTMTRPFIWVNVLTVKHRTT